MKSTSIWIAIFLLLSGCGYSIYNIDKPPPEDYETWKKQNNSLLDIKKALLECGAIAPTTLGWHYKEAYEKIGIIEQKDQVNQGFLVDRCMLKAGFVQQNTSWALEDACADARYKALPACQPNAIIPIPSVERRLNSWYCKTKIDYDYCLKHALSPQLCNPEKTKNPPPECLADAQNHPIVTNDLDSRVFKSSSMSPETQQQLRQEQMQQQLQRDIQEQNNRGMQEMLKNTTPKIKR